MMFDDATVTAVGDWGMVVMKCYLGKIQPSVLFFEEMSLEEAAAPQLPPVSRSPPPAAAAVAPVPAVGGVWGKPRVLSVERKPAR